MKTHSAVYALCLVLCVIHEAASKPLPRKTYGNTDHLTIPSDDRDNYLEMPPFQPVLRTRHSQRPSGNSLNPSGGSVSVDAISECGVNAAVSALRQGNVWTSRGSSARADALGHYKRVYTTPERTRPNRDDGVTFSKRFSFIS